MSIVSLTDIQVSATNRLLEALHQSESNMRQRIDLLVEMVFELNQSLEIVFTNHAWETCLGYTDVHNTLLTYYILTEDISLFESAINRLNNEATVQVLLRLKHSNGSVLSMETSLARMGDGVLGAFHDITKQIKFQEDLKLLAQFDSLTKLPNRSLFNDRLEQALINYSRNGNSLAIAFLDVDNFKKINDQYGHDFGDKVLFEVARRLSSALRASDTIARFGGDEFIVLLNYVDSIEICSSILQKVLEVLQKPLQIENIEMMVSTSIGVTLYPQDDQAPEQLIRHADQAMYIAKESGKNQICFFDVNAHQNTNSLQKLIFELKTAMRTHALKVVYQPIVNLTNPSVGYAEALLRWHHPYRGLIRPDEFLPLIQTHPVIVELSKYVIESVLQQLTLWNREQFRCRVSINICGLQMQDPSFFDYVERMLETFSEVMPQQVQFEVVETSQLSNLDSIANIINKLKTLGLSFALDDFGTGFSSLSHLRLLPIDSIKIDKTFVMNMLANDEDLHIVTGIVSLSKAFKCQLIAEGVETKEVLQCLRELGCHLVQGYYLSYPLDAQDFLLWASTMLKSDALLDEKSLNE